jgi:hypothetical protein
MRRTIIGATLALLMTSGVAMADECDTMAAKIAENVGWRVQPRPGQGRFIPMSNGKEGASLNCGGTYGLNLHATRQLPDIQGEQDLIRAASILTKVAPANIRDGIQQCIKAAAVSVSTGDFIHQINLMKINGIPDSDIQQMVETAYKLATDKSIDSHKDHFADLSVGGGHIFCDLTVTGHEWLYLLITEK